MVLRVKLEGICKGAADAVAVGAAGLQALDFLDKSQPAPDSWKTQQHSLLDEAKKPKAAMLLMVVGPVQQLVDASATPPQHN